MGKKNEDRTEFVFISARPNLNNTIYIKKTKTLFFNGNDIHLNGTNVKFNVLNILSQYKISQFRFYFI